MKTVERIGEYDIQAREGERIVSIKPLVGQTKQTRRDVERIVPTGQYL